MSRRLLATGLLLALGVLLLSGCGAATAVPTGAPAPIPTEAATEDVVIEATEDTGVAGEGAVTVLGPEAARDAALTYLARAYGNQGPARDMAWTEENRTPERLVGASTFGYTSGDWDIEVSFPVVAPQDVVYRVTVRSEPGDFAWEGEVDAMGQVAEVTSPGGQSQPPTVGEDDVAELVAGNNAFALNLYQVLRGEAGNLFYSPYSISAALAMTFAGARGETEAQMADALSFRLDQQRLHPAFRALEGELESRGEGAAGRDSEGFRLNVANALWGQEGFSFLPTFLDLLAENYGAGMRLVDFANAAEEARLTINEWVSEETEGRIEDLIPAGLLDPATRLVLTNAIYFNAAWAEPFDPEATRDGEFHLLDGGQVTVPMMRLMTRYGYARGDGYQAVELPYDGYELSMVILLPDDGGFEVFEDGLDAEVVEAILGDLAPASLALTMPLFEFDDSFSLVDALTALGMPIAFTTGADFSGMTGQRDLFIDEVLHKAFVAVDEAGTEAAAATAVVMELTAVQEEPLEVRLDRPFLFLIRDLETGAVLFVGRVVDPSK